MKWAPMRFCGVSMRHNPMKLSISGKNRIREYLSPCCEADSQLLGKELCRVAGEGVLYGIDCLEQYRKLEQLQLHRTPAKLVLPQMQPMYAYLKELSLTAQPEENILHYRFVFAQTQSPRKATKTVPCYITASEGESMWDISYDYGTSIEKLTALNPHIPLIDRISGGERVRIC